MLVYRQNRLFKINLNELPEIAKNTETLNALYAALFLEFRGAEENDKYNKKSYTERMEAINNFAENWLKKQGYK